MAAEQGDWRAANTLASQMAEAAKAEADTAKNAAVAAKVAFVVDVVVTHAATIAISSGSKVKTVDVPDARINDRIYVHRNGEPAVAGVNVGSSVMLEATGYVPADGKVNVYHSIPQVSLGQSLTIPLRLIGYRPAAI
jgi:hypothetical protein